MCNNIQATTVFKESDTGPQFSEKVALRLSEKENQAAGILYSKASSVAFGVNVLSRRTSKNLPHGTWHFGSHTS